MESSDWDKLGLSILEEFISEQEESEILENFLKSNVPSRNFRDGRNRIARYGSKLPYNSHVVSENIPEYLDALCDKIFQLGLVESRPDSVTVNEYMKGQGIAPHVDSPASGPKITILCLMSSAVMKFQKKDQDFSVVLPRRCLVQMQEEIRYKWRHSIEPVSEDRYSIVFRTGTKIKGRRK